MVGPEDARDRAFGSQVLRAGYPALEAAIVTRLDRLRQALTITGARFVMMPVQCDQTANVSTANIDWLNRVLAHYARTRGSSVQFAPEPSGRCARVTAETTTTWQHIATIIAHS
jgi:hypothetical protein